ncbi:MAG: hypothetical protein CMP21_01880 [Rickettsiales bacterium]|nr:hypothetical protein [Rickettsiales bacterium]|tara:strand:+ start:1806 stop:3026 length:1221 start_codon:yes stop_codon:yes gene_type:complete
MGVLTQALTYTSSEDEKAWIEQAENAYQKNDIDNCVVILTKACESCKGELVKRPHSKACRHEIQLIWEFILEKVKQSLVYKEADHTKIPHEKVNPINSIKAYVIDSFVETEWKKQCLGKFGGPKKSSLSWKESYLNNEIDLEKLDSIESKFLWAIKKGHSNYVKFLLSQNEDINLNKLLFENNVSIISKAISKNYVKLTTFLLDENMRLNTTDAFGWTPLHHAINRGNLDIIKQLVAKKVALNVRNKDGHTPLQLAIMKSRSDIVKFLLLEGCKVNYKDKNGVAPIYYALMTKDIHMIEILIENGADLKGKDDFGRTLIHLSAILGYASILKELLVYKMAIDAKDYFGRTALHYAAQYGRSNCLDVLLRANAKTTIQDNFNETPLLVAAFSENKAEIAMLHEYGRR